ncbi:hypothetical protein [Bradyrhizobium sp. URHD0069]|uniref:hypothetical protein n=1 Tax=Bradyrhizobium sp. URHD0069 TaxID=1380355 RepID=UPI000495459F|nr:hypothetical protein [Bradyrhizobium sp. URHD0069]
MEKIRKVEKSLERSYRPVVIWIDDLAEIIDTLKRHPREIDIRTADHRYEGLDDLKEHVGGQTQFDLTISSSSGSGPSVSLELKRMAVRLWVFDPRGGPEAAQIFHEINEVITRCQRRFAALYSLLLMFAIVPFFLLTQFFLVQQSELSAARAASVVGSVVSLWFLWACYVIVRCKAVIKLQRRSEIRPFIERNKDQLMLLLIGAIVGGLITFAGVVAKEHFYPSATQQR